MKPTKQSTSRGASYGGSGDYPATIPHGRIEETHQTLTEYLREKGMLRTMRRAIA